MQNLALYIIRALFSKERVQHLDQHLKVVHTAKDGKTSKVFPSLESLAAGAIFRVLQRGQGYRIWMKVTLVNPYLQRLTYA